MDVVDVLSSAKSDILDQAAEALQRSHQKHYEASGPDESRRRLERLFDLVVTSLGDRDLVPVLTHAEQVARDRFDAGYGIGEVQTAFNVLEEAMWLRVAESVAPLQLAEAIGLLSTVLGAGKDELARAWVSLATNHHVPSLDLSALFQGTEQARNP